MLYSKGWKKKGLRHPSSQLTDLSRSTWQTRLHLPNAVSKDNGFSEWSSLILHPSLHHESIIFSWAICAQIVFSKTATKCFTAYCWKLQGMVYVKHAPSRPPPHWVQDTYVVSSTTERSKILATCQIVCTMPDWKQIDTKWNNKVTKYFQISTILLKCLLSISHINTNA